MNKFAAPCADRKISSYAAIKFAPNDVRQSISHFSKIENGADAYVQWGPVHSYIHHHSHHFATQSSHFVDKAGWQIKWLPLNCGYYDAMRTAPIVSVHSFLMIGCNRASIKLPVTQI